MLSVIMASTEKGLQHNINIKNKAPQGNGTVIMDIMEDKKKLT